MVYKPFYIRCQGCNERFLPDRSPRKGAAKVVRGEISECSKCKKPFGKIMVPIRPLVLTAITELGGVAAFAEMAKQYRSKISFFRSVHTVYALGFPVSVH